MNAAPRQGDERPAPMQPVRPPALSPEELRRQRSRNKAIAWVLVALAVMFFVVTIAKLGPGILDRPL